MDDSLLVRRVECVGDLLRDGQDFIDRDRAAHNALRQIIALDELHHEGVHAGRLFGRIDRRDAGMVQ